MRFESGAGREVPAGKEPIRFRNSGRRFGAGKPEESGRVGGGEAREGSPFPDYYGHLGIHTPQEAKPADIRARFKALAQHYGSTAYLQATPREVAISKLERTIKAYRVLGDPPERERYDQEKERHEQSSPGRVEERLAELSQEVERENGLRPGTLSRSHRPPGERTPSSSASSARKSTPDEVQAAYDRVAAEVEQDQKHGRGGFGGVVPVDGTASEIQPHERALSANQRKSTQEDLELVRRTRESRDKDLQAALSLLREIRARRGQ
jgi:curved DNA-binding protein CbpA